MRHDTKNGKHKNGNLMHRLRQLFFVADPISSEAREMLEKNYENGYLIGEVLLSSKKKHEEVTLKDGAKVYMDIA